MKKLEPSLKRKMQILFWGAVTLGCLIGIVRVLMWPSVTRGAAAYTAAATGANWVVVQLDMNGHAFRCWSLVRTSVVNESDSDGIYWLDPDSGNLVHISGMYNRVQVADEHWDHAYHELGLTHDLCQHIHDHQDLSER